MKSRLLKSTGLYCIYRRYSDYTELVLAWGIASSYDLGLDAKCEYLTLEGTPCVLYRSPRQDAGDISKC